jgi:hypothetical protein
MAQPSGILLILNLWSVSDEKIMELVPDSEFGDLAGFLD